MPVGVFFQNFKCPSMLPVIRKSWSWATATCVTVSLCIKLFSYICALGKAARYACSCSSTCTLPSSQADALYKKLASLSRKPYLALLQLRGQHRSNQIAILLFCLDRICCDRWRQLHTHVLLNTFVSASLERIICHACQALQKLRSDHSERWRIRQGSHDDTAHAMRFCMQD